MSGLDVASGIAGLIALTITVGNTIAQYVTAVKDQSKSVKELHEELDLLGSVLSRLGDFLRSEKSNGRAFEQDSILVKSISDCKRRIERIGDKLRTSNGGKLSRVIDKLKWPFEQKDVLQLVDNLRRYIHTFEFALTIKNSEFLSQNWNDASKSLKDLQKRVDQACETNKLLGEPIDKLLERSQQLQQVIDILPALLQQSEDLKEVAQTIRLAEQRELERRKAEILDWLTPLSTLHKHVELQHRRAPGTCRWLLDNEIFVEWVESSDIQYDILCQGGPGVGKTVLCSMVTDHLRTKYKHEEVAIVYYYFDLAEQQAQTEYSLARSILRQLCQSFKSIPTAVADFYQRTRNELQDSLWLQELQSILQRVASTFSQCFIIIDAFDEMENRKRKSLIGVLEAIKACNGRVKFFATSRPYVELEHFQHALRVDVRADDQDLREHLRQKIESHPQSSDIIDDMLKAKILDKLCAHADGVFLLPALQIDQILDQAVSPGDIERSLDTLSTDLKAVFQSTITRIENFSGGKRNLAFKTLMWLSHARRPLRIAELQHALAVRPGGMDLDTRDISSISVILDSCCGLIDLDGESACVRFVHGSIAEYLQTMDHGFFQDAELEIVRTCLKYLTMDHLKTLPFKNRGDFIRAMEAHPLLDYASSYWGYHARGVNVQLYQDLAVPFLNSSVHLLLTARVRDIKTPEYRKWKERMLAWSVSGGAGISLTASFGLADLIRLLISQSQHPVLTARNVYGSTPLHESAVLGYEDVAEILIAHGADVLDSNQGKATPFYLAVSYGQLSMCRLLLRYGKLQLDVACKSGYTALHKAADLGSEATVEFLLQSGALVEARNAQAMTALHLAARRGHTHVAQLLILGGANADATENERMTPLDLAALGGHHETVEYLLRQGVSVNHKSKESWTPLHRAARSGHSKVVEMLLAGGASVFHVDRQRATPFQQAVKSGDLDTVKLIIYHNEVPMVQQLKHKDWKKDRAIDMAFYASHYHIYAFLRDLENTELQHDPRVQIPVDPLLPLTHAIEGGDLERTQLLLETNPEWLTLQDTMDQTPLHTAFRTAHWEIAEHMLSLGASINARGYHGWTPLHIAASLGNIRMLELALQYDADINLVSETLQTPLHKAASSRSVPVITELLRCGCLPSAVNDKSMTPVHVAARQNFLEGVQVMIRPEFGGRDLLFLRDKYGRTPRDWASRAGHLDTSSVLREEERRAKGRTFTAADGLSMNMNMNTTSASNRPVAVIPNPNPSQQRRITTNRQSMNKDSQDRTSTSSSSLLLPSIENAMSPGRMSTGSLDELVDTGASPLRSRSGTPNVGAAGRLAMMKQQSPHPSPSPTPSPSPAPKSSVDEIELGYMRMQIEFESD